MTIYIVDIEAVDTRYTNSIGRSRANNIVQFAVSMIRWIKTSPATFYLTSTESSELILIRGPVYTRERDRCEPAKVHEIRTYR